MNISFVIVSFKSFHLVEKIIDSIPKENEVIIIENSLDYNLKNKIENLHNNTQVIIPEKNLGYGKALNLGIKKSKSKYVVCMVADISLEKKSLIEISKILEVFEDFSILSE